MHQLALVTVLYKSDEVLADFWESLSKQVFSNYHLYIVDNSSNLKTDQLLTSLVKQFPISGYTHIKNDQNYGAAKGNNQGIEAALKTSCTHILLLNNDIEIISDQLLTEMYEYAVNNQEALIIPKMLYYDTRKICMAGGLLNNRTGVTVHVGAGEEDFEQYDKPRHFNYGPTTFMMIAREVFENVGFIDERYFAYYEDTDFIYRATKLGYQVYYMPSLVILHKESTLTGGQKSNFFVYYINRNRLYFIRKHFRGLHWFSAMLSMGLDFLRMFKHYHNGQRKVLIKAVWHGLFYKEWEHENPSR